MAVGVPAEGAYVGKTEGLYEGLRVGARAGAMVGEHVFPLQMTVPLG